MNFLNIFYSKTVDDKKEVIKYDAIAGLLHLKCNSISKTYEFRLFGIKLLYSKLKGYYKKYYFLFLPILLIKATNQFLTDFLDNLIRKYPQYDDYYVFLSRSGEFFLLMHHLKEWLQKNKSTNFVLIFSAKYHLNICKMFFPEIPCIYMKNINVPLISRGIKKIKTAYKNKNFYVPTYERYFVDVENKIRDNNNHYYELLKSHLNLSNKTDHYSITDSTKEKVAKIVNYFLDNNFIFISPETLSNEPMEKDFWEDLSKKIKAKGYKIYCNAMFFHNLIPNSEAMFLTYEESIELAKYAKGIIGMRSGFIECLSQNNVPMFVLYTDFPKRQGFKRLSSDKVLNGYSIKKLPYVNKDNLYEYDVNKYKKQELIIAEILNKLEVLNSGKSR